MQLLWYCWESRYLFIQNHARRKKKSTSPDGWIQNYLQHDHKMFPWHRHRREDELRTDDILTLVHEPDSIFLANKTSEKGAQEAASLIVGNKHTKVWKQFTTTLAFYCRALLVFSRHHQTAIASNSGAGFPSVGGKYSCFHTSKDAGFWEEK